MQKTTLTVQPVKKYKKPRYPSWQDPNPLDHPNAAPFPFSKKVLRLLAAAGMAGAAFSSCSNESGNYKNDPNWVPADSLRNVFTFEMNGLPYQSPAFGTGEPINLDRRFALEVLESLAKKEGFKMKQGYVFESEGVKITLDGWDAERRTGFVFLDGKNLEDGVIGWDDINTALRITERDSVGDIIRQRGFSSWSEAWDFYDGHFPDFLPRTPFFNHLTAAKIRENERLLALEFPQSEERLRRKLAFLKDRTSITLVDSEWDPQKGQLVERHVFPQLEKLLKELAASPDFQKQVAFYEDYEKIEPIIHKTFKYKNTEKHWISLFSLAARAERQQKTRQWSRLLLQIERDKTVQERLNKVLANPDVDPLETFAAELEAFDRETVSLAELHGLDQLAASSKAFVMPVSMEDGRFFYEDWRLPREWGGPFSDSTPPPALLDSLEKYQQTQLALPDSLQNAGKAWRERNILDALSELERQARFYLRWAKSQGQ